MLKRTLSFIFSFFIVFDTYAQVHQWAKKVDGATDNFSVTVDAAGNSYTIGRFSGTVDLDPGTGTLSVTAQSQWIYTHIVKLNPNGDLIWAKVLGGVTPGFGMVNATDIKADNIGNIYLAGLFDNTVDFDPGTGSENITSNGAHDAFVLKLDTAGNFIWVKAIGGAGTDRGRSLTVDVDNNIYVAGLFSDQVDLDPGTGTDNHTSSGLWDVFLLKLDTSGAYLWATVQGDANTNDESGMVATNGQGDVYWQSTVNGAGTIVKASSTGLFLNTLQINGKDLEIDENDNVYVAGSFTNTTDFDPSASIYNLTALGNSTDIFVLKLSSDDELVWVKQMAGHNNEEAVSIDVKNSGVYVSGFFKGITDFDPSSATIYMSAPDTTNNDVFYLKLDTAGTLVWVKQLGNEHAEFYISIAVDNNSILMAGSFKGTVDFDPGSTTFNMTTTSNYEGYIRKLGATLSVIDGELAKGLVVIYPNPSGGDFIVRSSGIMSTIGITDALGRNAYQSTVNSKEHKVSTVLSAGLYYISVLADGRVTTQKLLRE